MPTYSDYISPDNWFVLILISKTLFIGSLYLPITHLHFPLLSAEIKISDFLYHSTYSGQHMKYCADRIGQRVYYKLELWINTYIWWRRWSGQQRGHWRGYQASGGWLSCAGSERTTPPRASRPCAPCKTHKICSLTTKRQYNFYDHVNAQCTLLIKISYSIKFSTLYILIL